MSTAPPPENPYLASSSEQDRQQEVPPADVSLKAQMGSLGIIFLGFVLLLGGYFVSNFFAISDLYQLGLGPSGEVLPSPFADTFTTPAQKWMLYVGSALAAVLGLVMIGSQKYNPMAAVCYFMCPLVGITFLVAWPLRAAQKHAVATAAAYLAVGTCLAAIGVMRLTALYGQSSVGFDVVTGSMLAEVGFACALGALLKLWNTDSNDAPATASTAVSQPA